MESIATSRGEASAKTSVNDDPFKLGDRAVHPGHGVGEVLALEERDLGGSKHRCYVLKMVDTGMKVMVPTSAVKRVGLRAIMKKHAAEGILDILRSKEVAVDDAQPWNRRFRAYTELLKSGAPDQIAQVLRDMYRLKLDKALSFGERRLLDQARSLLVHELALAKCVERSAIEAELQQILAT